MEPKRQNRVAEIRKQRMMSKAELARAAGISPLTIDRVERGYSCRMDTKRKIIRALGLDLSQAALVFPEEAEPAPEPSVVSDDARQSSLFVEAPPRPLRQERPKRGELAPSSDTLGDITSGATGEGNVPGAS
jgi:DNA-binding XRE family transcriptional regulator